MKNKLDQLQTPKSWKIEKLWILSQTFLSQFKISSSANSRIKIVQEADPKARIEFFFSNIARETRPGGSLMDDGGYDVARDTSTANYRDIPKPREGGALIPPFPPRFSPSSNNLHIRSSSISPISSLEQLAKASLDFRLTIANNFALLVSWKEYRERTRNLLSRLIRKTFLIPCTLYVTTLR